MDTLTVKQTAVLSTKLGDITVRIPSLTQKLQIERKRTIYAGGLSILSQEGADLADMFANLDVIMTDCPTLKRDEQTSTWNFDEFYDEDALRDAYAKVREWLDSFRKGLGSEQKEVGQN